MGAREAAASSLWAPLQFPVFRALWLMWLLTTLCMWMGNVAAAWLMALLPVPPLWVALVQAATTLPVLLFGLPMGTLADRTDRRRLMLGTQLWLGSVALAQAALALAGALSAPVLLATTLAFGCGYAARLPVFAAAVPGLVPRSHLPAALALNAVTINTSRIVGPVLTGVLLAVAGAPLVFVVVAAISLACWFLVLRWRQQPAAAVPVSEPFWRSMADGVRFMAGSPALRRVLLRVFLFFLWASALPALLPLVARGLGGSAAQTFTGLLASMGVGAVASLSLLQRLRGRMSPNRLVFASAVVHAVCVGTVAVAGSVPVGLIAMFFVGVTWVMTSNPLTVSAQLALPDRLRARGMAIHQMAMFGSSALGAALWGQVATLADVPGSLLLAAGSGVVAMAVATRRQPLPSDHV